ncbi:hypothetical protein LR004_00510 [Candidatus Gracilibacteria bacterium]|nr:hypothetical protein [Candidatus Gracilibacteria bacterium]
MMGFIKFLQKRPTDTTIMIARMIVGMIIIGGLYYNLIVQGDKIESNFFWIEVPAAYLLYIKYFFIAIGIIPLMIGVLNICVIRKKWMKILQITAGILLMYISSKILPGDANKLDIDSLIAILGFASVVCGITGKCITGKCLKFGETITKIRV